MTKGRRAGAVRRFAAIAVLDARAFAGALLANAAARFGAAAFFIRASLLARQNAALDGAVATCRRIIPLCGNYSHARNVAFFHQIDDRLDVPVAERDLVGDRDRAVGGRRHDIGRGAGGWRRRQRRSVEPVAGGDIEGLLGIENRASCT